MNLLTWQLTEKDAFHSTLLQPPPGPLLVYLVMVMGVRVGIEELGEQVQGAGPGFKVMAGEAS